MSRLVRVLAVVVGIGVLYEVLSRSGVNPRYFPGLLVIWEAAAESWRSGQLTDAMLITATEFGISLTLALATGLILGYLIGRSELLRRAFVPVITFLYGLPIIVAFPLFLLVFGFGSSSKIALAVIYGTLPMTLYTIQAVDAADREMLRVARAFGAPRWREIWDIRIPSGLPALLRGVQMATGLVIIGVVAGEVLGSAGGLGYVVSDAAVRFDVPTMYAVTILVASAALLANVTLDTVHRRLARWADVSGEPNARKLPGGIALREVGR